MIIKSGGRGRPIEVNIYELQQQFYEAVHPAERKLAEIRRTTSGMRGEEILGTQTTHPSWVTKSLDILEEAEDGRIPTYKEIKEIRENLQSLKQLASKQERVSNRAIAKQLSREYLKQLERAQQNQSEFTREQLTELERNFEKLTLKEQQEFLLSKDYQDPNAIGRYKRVKDWAEADSGRRMSYSEAFAYTINARSKG